MFAFLRPCVRFYRPGSLIAPGNVPGRIRGPRRRPPPKSGAGVTRSKTMHRSLRRARIKSSHERHVRARNQLLRPRRMPGEFGDFGEYHARSVGDSGLRSRSPFLSLITKKVAGIAVGEGARRERTRGTWKVERERSIVRPGVLPSPSLSPLPRPFAGVDEHVSQQRQSRPVTILRWMCRDPAVSSFFSVKPFFSSFCSA